MLTRFGDDVQLNSLKRYLRLQSLPSIQEAYALPDSPHHVATITSSLQKMQLVQFTHLAPQSLKGPALHEAASNAVCLPQHVEADSASVKRRAQHAVEVSIAAHAAGRKAELGMSVGAASRMGGWDDSGVQHMQFSSNSSRIGSEGEEQYWKEQSRLQIAAQQVEACQAHLSW